MKRIKRVEYEQVSVHNDEDFDVHVQWTDLTWETFYAGDPMQKAVATQFAKQCRENNKLDKR